METNEAVSLAITDLMTRSTSEPVSSLIKPLNGKPNRVATLADQGLNDAALFRYLEMLHAMLFDAIKSGRLSAIGTLVALNNMVGSASTSKLKDDPQLPLFPNGGANFFDGAD